MRLFAYLSFHKPPLFFLFRSNRNFDLFFPPKQLRIYHHTRLKFLKRKKNCKIFLKMVFTPRSQTEKKKWSRHHIINTHLVWNENFLFFYVLETEDFFFFFRTTVNKRIHPCKSLDKCMCIYSRMHIHI